MIVDTARDNMRAAGLMILAMAAFTINDTFLKAVSAELPLSQALFLRGCLTSALIGAVVWQRGLFRVRLASSDRWRVGARGLAEAAAAFFFLTALFNMPIANATAVLQALPLTVTLAGALFMGEPLGWRRLTAILVGFVGVLLILRPGSEGFNIFALSAVAAVLAVTARDLLARTLTGSVPSLVAAFWSALPVTILGLLLSLTGGWVWPSLTASVQLTGSALFIFAAYILSVAVMRIGDIAFVAPFRYTGLLWALALGYLVFDEWPDAVTLVGAGIVVATGIYTFHRERQLGRRAAAPRKDRVDNPCDSPY